MSRDESAASGTEDLKAKFREALDRKHDSHAGVEHKGHGKEKAHDTHGPVGGKREFRRKSG